MNETTRAILAGIAVVVALALAWQLSSILLICFAGVLVAALLDAAVQPLCRRLPVPRPLLVVTAALGIALLIGIGLSLGGVRIWQSLDELWTMLRDQTTALYQRVQDSEFGDSLGMPAGNSFIRGLLPDPGGLFSGAGSIFGSMVGVLSNAVIIAFLGLFLAIDPARYRDGLLLLVPARHRARGRTALDATGQTLRGWLVTQLAVMVLIGVLVYALLSVLGSPNALALGVLAGVLNFVPYLGPILSAVPILLTLAGGDWTTLWVGALGLLVIQNLEGYVVTPLLQQRIINLPPAWSLVIIAGLGLLFGPLGVALATPLFAVARTLTFKLYIEPRDAPSD